MICKGGGVGGLLPHPSRTRRAKNGAHSELWLGAVELVVGGMRDCFPTHSAKNAEWMGHGGFVLGMLPGKRVLRFAYPVNGGAVHGAPGALRSE